MKIYIVFVSVYEQMDNKIGFTRILVPIDGSAESLQAAEYATGMASLVKGSILLLHVAHQQQKQQDHNDIVTGADNSNFKSTTMELESDKIVRILETIQNKSRSINVEIKAEIVNTNGSVSDEIVSYAQKQRIDLIIVGAMGSSPFRKALLGSTDYGIIAHAPCSVMVAK